MTFSYRLNLLMSIFGISNVELAKAIHVDVSLISRFRSGKRSPTKSGYHVVNMCTYFASLPRYDYQNTALANLLEVSLDKLRDTSFDLATALHTWLGEQAVPAEAISSTMQAVNSFLEQTDVSPVATAISQDYMAKDIGLYQGRPINAEVFYGFEGFRMSTSRLLRATLDCDEPQTILEFSDQSLEWINGDAEYCREWTSLMMQCLAKGHRFKVVLSVYRDIYELFTIIERWMPFYITGNVEIYYCPRLHEALFRRSMCIVPGVGASVSNCLTGLEYEAEYFLYLNQAKAEYMKNMYNEFLAMCKPMIRVFTAENVADFNDVNCDFHAKKGNNIMLLYTLSSFTVPESLFLSSMDRAQLDAKTKAIRHQWFRTKHQLFEQSIADYQQTDIMMLPNIEQLRYKRLPINLAPYLGEQTLYYTKEDMQSHIRNTIAYLEKYDNYNLYFLKNLLFKNVQIMVKEEAGAVFTKEYTPFLTFSITQPNMTQAFYYYLENLLGTIPKAERSKKYVIEQLNRYLEF